MKKETWKKKIDENWEKIELTKEVDGDITEVEIIIKTEKGSHQFINLIKTKQS